MKTSETKIQSAGRTDKGKIRSNNEDSLLVDVGNLLFAVADGIGGHRGGEVASSIAVDALREAAADRRSDGPEASAGPGPVPDPALAVLDHAFRLANDRIIERGASDPGLAGMGTTLTSLLLRGNTAHIAHVGDSRSYLLRNATLEQITEDHGVAAEQVRAGLITPDQARKSPYRHVITRALGIQSGLQVDHRAIPVLDGDLFLLCTDGLTEMIDDRRIGQILKNSPPAIAAESLIAAANESGGADNITVVVIRIEAVG